MNSLWAFIANQKTLQIKKATQPPYNTILFLTFCHLLNASCATDLLCKGCKLNDIYQIFVKSINTL